MSSETGNPKNRSGGPNINQRGTPLNSESQSTRKSYFTGQPWIHTPWTDILFVLFPAFLATGLILFFPRFFQESSEMQPWFWLLFIVGVDVAHVYSTLFRTYFDKQEFNKYRRPLLLIPVIAWGVGAMLYLVDGMIFWRILAYLAVYHFVRQQYGFFSIYARKENRSHWERLIDSGAIYMATIYPLVYWHTHLPRNFFWFLPGDFVSIPWPVLEYIALGFYGFCLLAYLVKEIRFSMEGRPFNLPKNLILLGTILSWGIGIVWMNGDLAFTATNVLAHGIPYMALIWFYGRKKALAASRENARPKGQANRKNAASNSQATGNEARQSLPSKSKYALNWRSFFKAEFLPVFVGLLFVLAYFEEGLWDGLVWRDHGSLFPWAKEFPWLQEEWLLALVIPLLALPQITHYVIDGFIWRVRKPKSETEQKLFGGE